MVSPNTSPRAPGHLTEQPCPIEYGFRSRRNTIPGLLTAMPSKRFDRILNVFTRDDFIVRNFRYGIHLRFTIMIEGCFGITSCEPGSIHTEKIEDVAFNAAM
jgi:hypothetical protein